MSNMSSQTPNSPSRPSAAITASHGDSLDTEAPITAKATSAIHSAVDIAAENLERAEIALKEARESAGLKASETAKHAQLFSEETLNATRNYIHEYPLRSLGIALATGYLLSAMLKK